MFETLPAPHPTWNLKRFRRQPIIQAEEERRLRQIAFDCHLKGRNLTYRGSVTHVRPTTAALLFEILSDIARPHPIPQITTTLYGRAATLRSVRQIVFRANRDFERVGCPVLIHCQSLQVFAQYRPPRFQTSAAVNRYLPNTNAAAIEIKTQPIALSRPTAMNSLLTISNSI